MSNSPHPGGYGRTASYSDSAWRLAAVLIMHPRYKAGDKGNIDAGDKLSIIDLDTGEIIPVEVFCRNSACSQLTYVEAVMSQKKE